MKQSMALAVVESHDTELCSPVRTSTLRQELLPFLLEPNEPRLGSDFENRQTAAVELRQLIFQELHSLFPGEPRRYSPKRRDPFELEIEKDTLLNAYIQQLENDGVSKRGIETRRYHLRAILRAAKRISGRYVDLLSLFLNESLLGLALTDVESTTGQPYQRSTLKGRRSAIRSVGIIMRPELLPVEPLQAIDRALKSVMVRVGTGYRVTGTTQRKPQRHTPSLAAYYKVLNILGKALGFEGIRNRVFFLMLFKLDSRITALRLLDGADFVLLPNGRVVVYLADKGKPNEFQVELGKDVIRELNQYIEAVNHFNAARGINRRVCLGQPGFIWQTLRGEQWGPADVRKTLRAACAEAQVTDFTPHAARRLYATTASSNLPRSVVADAGGWSGNESMDNSYIIETEERLHQSLNGSGLNIPVSKKLNVDD